MFASAGMFYEFEKWEDPTPNAAPSHVYSRSIKKSPISKFQTAFRRTLGTNNHSYSSGEAR